MPCYFFGATHPNMKCMLCKFLFFISNSEIQVVKGEKNQQLLEHVNGEEGKESKLLLPNILFTIFITTINPMKHTLGIFHSIENPFMNEVY